jgi:transposase
VLDERDARIAKLEAQVAALLARIAELEAKLGQNSSNSSRPPSSDAPADRDARRGKQPTGRPRGGQPGHKGWKRTLLPDGKHLWQGRGQHAARQE